MSEDTDKVARFRDGYLKLRSEYDSLHERWCEAIYERNSAWRAMASDGPSSGEDRMVELYAGPPVSSHLINRAMSVYGVLDAQITEEVGEVTVWVRCEPNRSVNWVLTHVRSAVERARPVTATYHVRDMAEMTGNDERDMAVRPQRCGAAILSKRHGSWSCALPPGHEGKHTSPGIDAERAKEYAANRAREGHRLGTKVEPSEVSAIATWPDYQHRPFINWQPEDQ